MKSTVSNAFSAAKKTIESIVVEFDQPPDKQIGGNNVSSKSVTPDEEDRKRQPQSLQQPNLESPHPKERDVDSVKRSTVDPPSSSSLLQLPQPPLSPPSSLSLPQQSMQHQDVSNEQNVDKTKLQPPPLPSHPPPVVVLPKDTNKSLGNALEAAAAAVVVASASAASAAAAVSVGNLEDKRIPNTIVVSSESSNPIFSLSSEHERNEVPKNIEHPNAPVKRTGIVSFCGNACNPQLPGPPLMNPKAGPAPPPQNKRSNESSELPTPSISVAVTVKPVPSLARKVAILGNMGVGKTSLILAISGADARNHRPSVTVGIDYTNVSVKRDGNYEPQTLELYDTAGSERFGAKSMALAFVRTMDAIVFVYDVGDQRSLEEVVTWKTQAWDMIGNGKTVTSLLVANKADVPPSNEEYDKGEGMARALSLGAFVDASAHTRRNVDSIVTFLVDATYSSVIKRMRQSSQTSYYTVMPSVGSKVAQKGGIVRKNVPNGNPTGGHTVLVVSPAKDRGNASYC